MDQLKQRSKDSACDRLTYWLTVNNNNNKKSLFNKLSPLGVRGGGLQCKEDLSVGRGTGQLR